MVSGDLYFTSCTNTLYSELLVRVFVTFGLSFMSVYMVLMETKPKFAFKVQIHGWIFFVTVREWSALAFMFLFMLHVSVGVQF